MHGTRVCALKQTNKQSWLQVYTTLEGIHVASADPSPITTCILRTRESRSGKKLTIWKWETEVDEKRQLVKACEET